MLLYSTTLEIKNSMTKHDFINAVIEWNSTNKYEENIIKGLTWNGSFTEKYGDEKLWLSFDECFSEAIIAVRYEKRDRKGAIWDTDYIMNFNSMKMTVQLDRVYTEDAIMEDLRFSTPQFIALLIEKGYLQDDNGLTVTERALTVDADNAFLLAELIKGEKQYRLPIVYVSKTKRNSNPISIDLLCKKMKGVAHVLVQGDRQSEEQISAACENKNVSSGGIEIYFPNGKRKRFPRKNSPVNVCLLLEKVTKSVFYYMNAQRLPPLATWHGVNSLILKEQYEEKTKEERQKSEHDIEKFIGTFDQDIQRLKDKIDLLTRGNESLKRENQGLRQKLNEMGNVPVLCFGNEEDFYQGEIREMILDAVADSLKNLSSNTRRHDVLKDILQANNHQDRRGERAKEVKSTFLNYRELSSAVRGKIKELGFEISGRGKHYQLIYYGDRRYITTIPKSGSDRRGGENIAMAIIRKMM